MILRDRIESCLRVLDKYHYVQCTTALPSARCSCGLHLVKSSLRANWHQLEAERDALAADLAAARALLRNIINLYNAYRRRGVAPAPTEYADVVRAIVQADAALAEGKP